jgi:hypothetical protein
MPYTAAAECWESEGNMEHGDCYRGCFVGEKDCCEVCVGKGGGFA